ncbi:translation initiation factor IF-2-like [Aquila chrysaetos chrysaetos]|uniref:translation initiation factor IF-2-like n=1 Tax=Aquila chrysaetos chrysaetos TaxID=223781 RepID=UPI001B7D2EDD|nr:translation initiation factor IF-2-like [Aquila chrysaetos chrysaetos]
MRPGGASARLVGERAQREARGKPPARTTPRPRATLLPGRRVRENYSSRHAPGGSPSLLPDPAGTPLPFPPTPRRRTCNPRRGYGQLRRAPAAGSGQSPPPLRHGAAPPARLRLRAAPAAAAPARHGAAPPRCRSVRPTRTPPSSSGLSPGPAGRLRSPATGPAPARSWSPAGTGGAWPDPPSASPPPPLGSLTAPRPVQRERKRSPEGNGDGRPVFVQPVARLTSPASESAPGLGAPPRRSPCPWETSAVGPRATLVGPSGNARSVGWLLERWAAGQRRRLPKTSSKTLEERRKGAAGWTAGV